MVKQARLKAKRKKSGLTLKEVSLFTRIAIGDLSSVETGKKPAFPSWRKRLAMIFKEAEKDLFPEVK